MRSPASAHAADRRGRTPRCGAITQTGAAVVEFVLVSVVLTISFMAVLQLGLLIHVRNTLVACAAEGARYAANADRSLDDGRNRALQLAEQAVSPQLLDGASARYIRDARYPGVSLVEVEITASLPLVGLLGPGETLVVRGHAVEEAS